MLLLDYLELNQKDQQVAQILQHYHSLEQHHAFISFGKFSLSEKSNEFLHQHHQSVDSQQSSDLADFSTYFIQ